MIIILILIVLFAIIGAPLFAVIGAVSIVNHLFTPGSGGINNIIIEISKIADMPFLQSIPLFTFAGYLLAHSKASQRLVRLNRAVIGWMPGGLAIVVIIACSIFTAFTGASGVTIVALGGLLLPALMQEKYNERYSMGLVTASGSFGLLFPPSLPVIIFAVIASVGASAGGGKVDIKELYLAGFVPGLFIMLALAVYAVFVSYKDKVERIKFTFKEFKSSLLDSIWEIPFPIIIFAGVFSGILVISDAAAITALYILIVEIFIKKDIKIKELPKIIKESMQLVGAILIILCISLAATNYIIYAQIPQKLFEVIQVFIRNQILFLIALNIFLLIVGCIMDIFSALVVVVPLILPIAEFYNINLLHLGVIFLTNLQIGYLTPPIGMNLFIASVRFNKSIVFLYRASISFIILLIGTLLVITYVPAMSLWFKEKPSIVGQWQYQDDIGNMDKISIKSNNKYIRRQGDMMTSLLNAPVYGSYEIKDNLFGKDFIILNNNGVKEQYNYEIYNDGKKLLFVKNGDKNKIFYINNLSEPIAVKTGQFIGKWENENNYIEFNYNKSVTWFENGQESVFGYSIIDSNDIVFFEYDENNNIKKRNNYKYKIKDGILTLILKNKEFKFNSADSICEN